MLKFSTLVPLGVYFLYLGFGAWMFVLLERPTETWQSHMISERQQEANILVDFSPLTLTPRDIAMGSIILSLLAVAALGNLVVFLYDRKG